jgi:ribosomal protein S18 acetylase RimI-like enzyme
MSRDFEVVPLREPIATEVRSLRDLLSELSSKPSRLDEADLARALKYPGNTILVARDRNGDLVGTITLQVVSTLTGEHARIEDVVVAERVRGRGIGRQLVAAALESARLRDVDHVDLTSRPSRREANGLYLRMGFERRDTNVYRYRVERNSGTGYSGTERTD